MICGTCKEAMKGVTDWLRHTAKTGCNWHREVWVKVLAAKRRGSSGRRLLSQAYPHLYKSAPMSEETKERLRELGEKRKGMGVEKRARRRRSEKV